MMEEPTVSLFEQLDSFLEDDLSRLKLIESKNAIDKNESDFKRKRHFEFVKYLVSVATHSIGLRASRAPFNCSQEQVLIYIMNMFNLNESDVRTIMIGNSAGVSSNTHQPVDEQSIKARKLHSWRPQLRAVLDAPTFLYNEKSQLANLNVRVYIFKGGQEQETAQSTLKMIHKTDSYLSKSNSILSNIFKKYRYDPAVLIRPVNEMRALIQYITVKKVAKSTINDSFNRTIFKMSLMLKETDKAQNDLKFNIRRYYCEPKTAHILRFEFWLENKRVRTSCLEGYRSCIRRLVFNRASSCCRKGRESTYMNENQEFYGYVNIKLTQVPSYPIKQNYPILSLKEQKINTCDICLEFRNRQISPSSANITVNQATGKSKPERMITHIRLYMNCLLYQSLALASSNINCSNLSITLENFFFLPAFTLINQHRLQNNLDLVEDQSLKRISILLLIIKLGNLEQISKHKSRFSYMLAILISVAQSEYMTGHLKVDGRTMQEINLFRNYSDSNIAKEPINIDGFELAALENYINKFLIIRLRKWLMRLSSNTKATLERSITLSGLKLTKSALSYFTKLTNVELHNIVAEVLSKKTTVSTLICKIVLSYLSSKLEKIIHSESIYVEKRLSRVKVEVLPKLEELINPWSKLFSEIKYINNDISLYWSGKGLNGLILEEHEFVKNLGMFDNLKKQDCFEVLRRKVDSYLS